jgi:hypothetical protein
MLIPIVGVIVNEKNQSCKLLYACTIKENIYNK